MRSRLLFVGSLLATFAVAAPALAQDSGKKKKDDSSAASSKSDAKSDAGGGRKDPNNVTGISPYMEKIAKGEKLAVARSFTEAVTTLQSAIADDPKNALGYILAGEAQLLKGDLNEAEAAWQNALRNAGADDVNHAKALFLLADLRERQGKADDAKTAWGDYGKFVADHPKSKGYPATAGERQRVVDVHNDLATKYGEVKARIKKREDDQKAQQAKDAQKDADQNDKKPRK